MDDAIAGHSCPLDSCTGDCPFHEALFMPLDERRSFLEKMLQTDPKTLRDAHLKCYGAWEEKLRRG